MLDSQLPYRIRIVNTQFYEFHIHLDGSIALYYLHLIYTC